MKMGVNCKQNDKKGFTKIGLYIVRNYVIIPYGHDIGRIEDVLYRYS